MTKAERILIVEDDPVIQETLTALLQPLFKHIDSATTAQAAHGKLGSADLIICDQHLDGKGSGLDLYLKCLKEHPGKPFLLVSALPDEVFEQLTGQGLSCPPFLPKPFNRQELHQAVAEVLSNARPPGR